MRMFWAKTAPSANIFPRRSSRTCGPTYLALAAASQPSRSLTLSSSSAIGISMTRDAAPCRSKAARISPASMAKPAKMPVAMSDTVVTPLFSIMVCKSAIPPCNLAGVMITGRSLAMATGSAVSVKRPST